MISPKNTFSPLADTRQTRGVSLLGTARMLGDTEVLSSISAVAEPEEMGVVLEDPPPDYARPVGLATLGCNSHFGKPYRIRSPHRIHIGDDIWVGAGASLSVVEFLKGVAYEPVLRIGSGSVVSSNLLVSCLSEISIGCRVGIAANVYIGDAFRDYSDLFSDTGEIGYSDPKPIRIEDEAAVGAGAAILPGVTIGKRAIVAANAVVTRDVPARSVVFGNPARVIRSWDDRKAQWVAGSAGSR